MKFSDLGLREELLKAIAEKGYTEPSPIQEKAIPVILEGRDVLASAQTGTGKTAGFTLPILQRIIEQKNPKYRPIKALILTPTRELAAQIYDNVRDYSKHLNIKSTVIFGGVKPKSQVDTIRRGVDVLVATPGRLLDLESQNLLSLARVDILILDEADRMLDMGFVRDINKVISLLPKKRQNLLFSATFNKEIKKLAQGILTNPVMVEAAPENTTAEMVNQKIYRVPKTRKTAMITQLIDDGNWSQVLVFTRTKHGANRLAEKLGKNGITAAAIHGNKSQNARTKALSGFKDNSVRVLVATDIAARGLDIPLLPHVINFELPNVPEDYVHRIGRTGRAGASGIAISLVSNDELEYVRAIEKLLKQKLEIDTLEGFDMTEDPEVLAQQKKSEEARSNGRRPSRSNTSKGSGNSKRTGASGKNRTSSNSSSKSSSGSRNNKRSSRR